MWFLLPLRSNTYLRHTNIDTESATATFKFTQTSEPEEEKMYVQQQSVHTEEQTSTSAVFTFFPLAATSLGLVAVARQHVGNF